MERLCEVCGEKARSPRHRTCSRSCSMKLSVRKRMEAGTMYIPSNKDRWEKTGPPDFWGPNNPNWKGGRRRAGRGKQYVQVIAPKEHPYASSRGYVMEHRLVMEAHIGRYLLPNEEVHHRNGIKDDNRIENLEIVTRARHRGQVTCPHCGKDFEIH